MAKFKKGAAEQKPKNWYVDRYESVTVQRNVLALITFAALTAAAIAVFAVAELTSSKSFEPYVIEVEKKTGITSSVSRNAIEKYTADEAVKRYFLVKYVQGREGYDPTDFNYNYTKVIRLMSTSQVFSQFRAAVVPENPDSPLTLPRGYKRVVKFKSISFIDAEKKKAQIRIAVDQLNENGQVMPDKRRNRIVTIDFDFVDLKLGEEDSYVNPLGFQVRGYRVDSDAD